MKERVYWDAGGNRVIQEETTSWADALGSDFRWSGKLVIFDK